MAGRVYSTHFFNRRISSSAQAGAAVYMVQSGKVAVVRSVDIFVDVLGALLVGRGPPAAPIHFVSSQSVPVYHCMQWEGYQVLNEGEMIVCQWLGGEHRVNVSGFLLDA